LSYFTYFANSGNRRLRPEKTCTHEVCLFAQEIRRRGLKVAVVGIPKTIDNDIPVRML